MENKKVSLCLRDLVQIDTNKGHKSTYEEDLLKILQLSKGKKYESSLINFVNLKVQSKVDNLSQTIPHNVVPSQFDISGFLHQDAPDTGSLNNSSYKERTHLWAKDSSPRKKV